MAITLKNLAWAETAEDRRVISNNELRCVGICSFSANRNDDVFIIEILENTITSTETGAELWTVIVKAEKNGVPLEVDNPLHFMNPPLLVPDGTFFTAVDDLGNQIQLSNYVEDAPSALKRLVFDTVVLTADKA